MRSKTQQNTSLAHFTTILKRTRPIQINRNFNATQEILGRSSLFRYFITSLLHFPFNSTSAATAPRSSANTPHTLRRTSSASFALQFPILPRTPPAAPQTPVLHAPAPAPI